MAGTVPPPITRPATLTLVNSTIDAQTFTEDERWELGYRFRPDACSGAASFPLDACGEADEFVAPDRPGEVIQTPFGVVAGDECSSFGLDQDEYERRANDLLVRCQSKAIATELWTGELSTEQAWGNQFLADSASDTVTDGPTAVIAALAALEGAVAACGCNDRGMIHATPQLVTQWAALGNSVLRREGNLLLTIHDTIVVTDGGYDGSGPGGEPAGETQWAYATGLVSVRVGQVQRVPGDIGEALDRRTNTVEFWAWRAATAAWNGCCHFAAQVDLSVPLVGAPS